MDTSSTPDDGYVESFEVDSSTSTSIQVKWDVQGAIVAFVDYFQVYYQKVASAYVQYGPKLPASANVYEIQNLVADTYYKVCLVTKRNDTGPIRQCVDASTTNWQLPVSLGSSIGAILALSIIVLIVLLSRCQIPYRYRKKAKTDPGKYDAMSANFHDERYFDFSETVTHGNEDDFTSEIDQEESGYYEPCNYELKHPRKPGERFNCANGNIRPLNTHSYLLDQRRHSLGRIHVHGRTSHHIRQMPIRALSMQSDQHPCSPLAKDTDSRHSIENDWRQSETKFSDPSLIQSQDMAKSDSFEQCHKPKPTDQTKRIFKQERVLQKQKSVTEHDDTFLCSQPAQDFLYIDEVPDTTRMLPTDVKETPPTSVKRALKYTETSFDDIDDFSTASFQKDGLGLKQPRPVEMTAKGRLKLLHDHSSMEEQAV